MSNLSIKLNLLKLKNTAMVNLTGKSGVTKRCVVIPIDENNLFVGESSIYLDLSAFELQNPQFDQTHLVKQSLSKEVFQKMTDEELKAMPILGGIKPFVKKEMQATEENITADETSDLPF